MSAVHGSVPHRQSASRTAPGRSSHPAPLPAVRTSSLGPLWPTPVPSPAVDSQQRAKMLKLRLQGLPLSQSEACLHSYPRNSHNSYIRYISSQVYRIAKSGNNAETASDLFDCKKLETFGNQKHVRLLKIGLSIASPWLHDLFTDLFQHILTYSNF